ncbi:uncharacterized protein LOC108091786 [Drosophila ficusphila]|uniref:uncharacterized protein LOC108091786 n=1 Tax=Drosophila ficusphila TaxID=30025 RepID=UPI0007E5BD8A|nr:uncharacterized protein LOC108091786 [Drosophila ficusphila]
MDSAEREKHLIKMLMPKHRELITTSRADYVDHTGKAVYTPPFKMKQEDPSLISGHCFGNLKVSGLQDITKTWPTAMDWREDYAQFVKRNKWCNEEIYKLFFVSPPVDFDLLKNYVKDLHKSVYMYDYSRNNFSSFASRRSEKVLKYEGGDYLTNYGCYYNRVQETEPFKSWLYRERVLKDLTLDRIAVELRKLFTKYNVTTYFDTICVPALMKAKSGIMPVSPIDRYQFRKY